MKLKYAIRMIEERERIKRKAEKEIERQKMPFGNQFVYKQNQKYSLPQGSAGQKNLVHVQSIFPKDDVLALKMKTKEPHVKEALLKAVYFYLENADKD